MKTSIRLLALLGILGALASCNAIDLGLDNFAVGINISADGICLDSLEEKAAADETTATQC